MSVVKRNRKESNFKFYYQAVELRKSIVFLLLRDFGVKSRIRNIEFYKTKMEEVDAKLFGELLDKYDIQNIPEEYPSWLIDRFRNSILDICQKMVKSITCAYTLWPTNQVEYEEKRLWQDRAIMMCEALLQEMTLAIDILPVNANKYVNYVNMIEEEIRLLKGWRKSTNKFNKDRASSDRAVSNSTNFANCNNNGNANNNNASNVGGVRPAFQ